jgi:hypothetical protein
MLLHDPYRFLEHLQAPLLRRFGSPKGRFRPCDATDSLSIYKNTVPIAQSPSPPVLCLTGSHSFLFAFNQGRHDGDPL